MDLLEDSLTLYAQILSRTDLKLQKNEKELWMEWTEFIAKYPQRATHIDAETILREATEKYPEEASKLWIFRADYYSRMGLFARAREVFDESLDVCDTVASFGILYAAYVKFEQTISELTEEEEDFERLE
jgi:pre-mRNA-splicing factor SYF1